MKDSEKSNTKIKINLNTPMMQQKKNNKTKQERLWDKFYL